MDVSSIIDTNSRRLIGAGQLALRALIVTALFTATTLGVVLSGAGTASAFGAAVSLNSAGGTNAGNGLKFTYGSGQIQVVRMGGGGELYSPSVNPSSTTAAGLFNGIYLAVGTTVIGPKNSVVANTSPNTWPANVVEWDAITTAGGSTGAGTITSTLTKTLGGLTYTVDIT